MELLLSTKLGQILILAAALILAHFVIKGFLEIVVKRIIRSHSLGNLETEERHVDTIMSVIGAVVSIILWVVGILGTLAVFRVNILGVVTGAGLASVVIGLGAQSIIRDFLAGMLVLMENQYRIGDIITLGTKTGKVESITLRITRLRDLDGDMHIVPNGSVGVITNQTYNFSSININIGVGYSSNIDQVGAIINDVGQGMYNDPYWNPSIIEAITFIRLDSFEDSSVKVKALGKVRPGEQWKVAGEFRLRLKREFEKHGIEIPFPQVVIHQPKTHQ